MLQLPTYAHAHHLRTTHHYDLRSTYDYDYELRTDTELRSSLHVTDKLTTRRRRSRQTQAGGTQSHFKACTVQRRLGVGEGRFRKHAKTTLTIPVEPGSTWGRSPQSTSIFIGGGTQNGMAITNGGCVR